MIWLESFLKVLGNRIFFNMAKSKKSKSIFLISLVFFATIAGSIFLFLPLKDLPDFIKQSENNKYEIQQNQNLAGYSNGLNFNSFYEKFYSRYEFVFTNTNPFSPVITIIEEEKNSKNITCSIYSFQRKDIFNFKLSDFHNCFMNGYKHEDAILIAKKQNLAENNPDSKNIIVEKLKESSENNDVERILKEMPENIKIRLDNLSSSNQEKFIKYYLIQKYTEQYNQKDAEDYLTELEKNNIPDTFDSAENIFNQHR